MIAPYSSRPSALDALLRMSHALASRRETGELLDEIASCLGETLQADDVAICLIDETGQTLRVASAFGSVSSRTGSAASWVRLLAGNGFEDAHAGVSPLKLYPLNARDHVFGMLIVRAENAQLQARPPKIRTTWAERRSPPAPAATAQETRPDLDSRAIAG